MSYIDVAFYQLFHDNVMMALQQRGSRLKPYVSLDELEGERGFYDFIEPDDDITTLVDDDTSVDTRHPDTVITDPTWTRRAITGSFLTKAYLLNHKDKVRVLADPTSKYIQNIAWAMGRKLDKLIIAAATGTAYTGHDGTVAVDLPASNIIADGGTGLTIDKLRQAKLIMDEADIPSDEPRYLVVTPRQIDNLLGATEVTSRDYNTVQALVQGQVDTFLGFKFITSNLLATKVAVDTTGTDDICFAFTKEGILLAINKQTEASIDKRPDKNNAIQIFFGMYAGATRMDEKRVVEIDCEQ